MPIRTTARPSSRIDPNIAIDLDTVAAPAISPDGASIAYVRAGVDPDSLRRHSHIEFVPFAGTTENSPARRLTAGPLDSTPTWSPDGRTLAFLRSQRSEDGTISQAQLWILPADGGESTQLTDLRGTVRSITWLPDSSALIAAAEVDPNAPDSDADKTIPTPKRVNRIYFRADGIGWRGDTHRQLFRVDVATSEAKQITRGDFDCYSPVPSPEGTLIAFASNDRSAQRERRTPGVAAAPLVQQADPPRLTLSRGTHCVVNIGHRPRGCLDV